MTIKNNTKSNVLKTFTLLSWDTFSKILISSLIRNEIICDDSDNYGKSIQDVAMNPTVKSICNVLNEMGLTQRWSNVEILMSLTLWGDSECIECGGEMEVVDGMYSKDSDTGETLTIWEEKQCQCCGFKTGIN